MVIPRTCGQKAFDEGHAKPFPAVLRLLLPCLLSIHLTACGTTDHSHNTSKRWAFSIQGELSDADVNAIVAIIGTIPAIDHRIVWMETDSPGSVRVYTGAIHDPLAGGGNVVTVKKRHIRWIVVGDPRESMWVS